MSESRNERIHILYDRASDVLDVDAIITDGNQYDDVATCADQLNYATKNSYALQFILEQILFLKDLPSYSAAARHLVLKMQIGMLNLRLKYQADLALKIEIDELIDLYQEQMNKFLLFVVKNSTVVFSHQYNIFDLVNELNSLFMFNYETIQESNPTVIDALKFLQLKIKNISTKEEVSAKNQEIFAKFVLAHFRDIYLSGTNANQNYQALLNMLPDKKKKLTVVKNDCDESLWNEFMKGVTLAVGNRNLSQYPWAKLNKDGSILVVTGPNDTKDNEELIHHFEVSAHEKHMDNLLATACQKAEYAAVDSSKPFINIAQYDDITEYTLNITPEQLDHLFKLYATLYSYRGENSVMKLNKSFTLKEGYIRMAPVIMLDDKEALIRADGCQMCEMPTVQLLHLLPDFDGKEKPFHWVPPEVESKLLLNRFDINTILNQIFRDNGLLINKLRFQGAFGEVIIKNPDNHISDIRIVDMDNDSKDFYGLYGNSSDEELQFSKSLEITTTIFFKYIRKFLEDELKQLDPEKNVDKIQNIEKSLALIKRMIFLSSSKRSFPQMAFLGDETATKPKQNNEEPTVNLTENKKPQ